MLIYLILNRGDGEFTCVSYLYFDLSVIPDNVSIKQAELVLFKSNSKALVKASKDL